MTNCLKRVFAIIVEIGGITRSRLKHLEKGILYVMTGITMGELQQETTGPIL
jgi:hypothetical protein